MTLVTVLLSLLGLYVAIGILFSIPFVLSGVKRLDPHAASGTWGFRMLIIPGTVFLWPVLLRRWISGDRQPPSERNAHRCAVRRSNVQTQIP